MEPNTPPDSATVPIPKLKPKKQSKKQKKKALKPRHQPIIDQEQQNFKLSVQLLKSLQQVNGHLEKQKQQLNQSINKSLNQSRFQAGIINQLTRVTDISLVRNVALQYINQRLGPLFNFQHVRDQGTDPISQDNLEGQRGNANIIERDRGEQDNEGIIIDIGPVVQLSREQQMIVNSSQDIGINEQRIDYIRQDGDIARQQQNEFDGFNRVDNN